MEYKVSELAKKTGVTKRTIHYYISKGLLLPPNGTGINSTYDENHVNRILLIKKLQSEFMPLNKIREYIMENPTKKIEQNIKKEEKDKEIYIRENVCNILELHYSEENGEKYKHIIENVKRYIEKMLED